MENECREAGPLRQSNSSGNAMPLVFLRIRVGLKSVTSHCSLLTVRFIGMDDPALGRFVHRGQILPCRGPRARLVALRDSLGQAAPERLQAAPHVRVSRIADGYAPDVFL